MVYGISDRVLLLIILPTYILSPLAGIILCGAYLLNTKKVMVSINHKILYIILISFYMGMLNTLKMPVSDLQNYYSIFNSAANYSMLGYLNKYIKEPAFYGLTYILHKITFGSIKYYIVIITTISYCFMLLAFIKYCSAIDIDRKSIVMGVLICALSPQIFSISAHLVRQVMAASILFYIIIDKIYYNRNHYILLLCAIFIHSTVLLFIPFIYIQYFKKRINIKNIIIIYVSLVLLIYILPAIMQGVIGADKMTYYNYAINRYAFAQRSSNVMELPLNTYILLSLVVVAGYIINIKMIKQEQQLISNNHFYNIFVTLAIFLMTGTFYREMMLRYYFYLYYFIPYYVIIVVKMMPRYKYIYLAIIIMIIVIILVINITQGVWKYESFDNMFYKNILLASEL